MEPELTPKSVHIVGRYAVYDAIAAGGMATVHYGRLLGPVGFSRTVAIKRLHAQFARDPEFVSMFLDEARLAARIRHPNVVPTLDVVATDGELFLVMEYVAGESLSRLVRTAAGGGRVIPPRIVASILCGVLRGLHAAHDATNERGEPLGIVHRDVSPQNVLVGIDGQARVLDFGVAKAAGRLQTTRDGKLKGKLAYMAPEQLRGKVLDRRTDIFAASAVLWEALTGRRLFRGDNEGAIVTKILEGRVEPPSGAVGGSELDDEGRAILAAVDPIVLKGLAADPNERFQTARDMAMALERAAFPAGVSEVSEWVEHFAKDVLVTRAQQVAEIESNSAVGPPDLQAIRDSTSELGSDSRPRASLPSGHALTPANPDLSTISVASHANAPVARRGRGPWVVGTAAGAIALLLIFVGARALRHDDTADAGAPVPSAAAPVVAAAPPAATVAPEPPPTSEATAEPPASARAGAVAAQKAVTPPVTPRPTFRPGAAPPRPAMPRPTPPAVSGCTPPYTIDGQGLKHFKPECL